MELLSCSVWCVCLEGQGCQNIHAECDFCNQRRRTIRPPTPRNPRGSKSDFRRDLPSGSFVLRDIRTSQRCRSRRVTADRHLKKIVAFNRENSRLQSGTLSRNIWGGDGSRLCSVRWSSMSSESSARNRQIESHNSPCKLNMTNSST